MEFSWLHHHQLSRFSKGVNSFCKSIVLFYTTFDPKNSDPVLTVCMFQVSGSVLWDTDKSQPDPGLKSSLRATQVLWPLTEQEELRRQVDPRQSHEPWLHLCKLVWKQMSQIACFSVCSVSLSSWCSVVTSWALRGSKWRRTISTGNTWRELQGDSFSSVSLPLIYGCLKWSNAKTIRIWNNNPLWLWKVAVQCLAAWIQLHLSVLS